MHFTRGPTVVFMAHSLGHWRQTVDPKSSHILGKFTAHMLGKWCAQGEVQESGVELGALGERDFSFYSARVNKGSAENDKCSFNVNDHH